MKRTVTVSVHQVSADATRAYAGQTVIHGSVNATLKGEGVEVEARFPFDQQPKVGDRFTVTFEGLA